MRYAPNALIQVLEDSAYQNIGALPSQFHPYTERYVPEPWKDLYIRPFKIAELKLISKAALLKDMSHMIRAIDLVITRDANELTIGDFYYVMMWLRIHSMPKTPMVVEWKCAETYLQNKSDGTIIFNDGVSNLPDDNEIKNYKEVECGTHNTENIHMSTVDVLELAEENYSDLPEGFDFPRARHMEAISTALLEPELSMLVSGIQWIVGSTFAEKLNKLESAPDGISMLDEAQAINETFIHGIKETTTLHCRLCKQAEPYVVQVGPFNFFR